jgi:exopolysaccharide production protein ExoQ
MHRLSLRRPRAASRGIDICAIVPILACAITLIIIPLLGYLNPSTQAAMEAAVSRPENRILWPALAAISIALTVQNSSRLAAVRWPPNIIVLLVYLAFAGVSALWAFSPQTSFTRFTQQMMIEISIVLPAMMARRTSDIVRGLFFCFALALVLNLFFVFNGAATIGHIGDARVELG